MFMGHPFVFAAWRVPQQTHESFCRPTLVHQQEAPGGGDIWLARGVNPGSCVPLRPKAGVNPGSYATSSTAPWRKPRIWLLTEYRLMNYCSNVSMTRFTRTTALAIVALVLPGLALAAPIAGACGLCGDGDDCHLQRSPEPATESHSCCDAETETSPEPSLGSSSCECGRDAPSGVTADSSHRVENLAELATGVESISLVSPSDQEFSNSNCSAAPPPAPPTYLLDCAFLT